MLGAVDLLFPLLRKRSMYDICNVSVIPTKTFKSVLGMWTKIIEDRWLQHFLSNNFYQHPGELEHVTSI